MPHRVRKSNSALRSEQTRSLQAYLRHRIIAESFERDGGVGPGERQEQSKSWYRRRTSFFPFRCAVEIVVMVHRAIGWEVIPCLGWNAGNQVVYPCQRTFSLRVLCNLGTAFSMRPVAHRKTMFRSVFRWHNAIQTHLIPFRAITRGSPI